MTPDALLDCIAYQSIAEGAAVVVRFVDRRWHADPMASSILYAAMLDWRERIRERVGAVS